MRKAEGGTSGPSFKASCTWVKKGFGSTALKAHVSAAGEAASALHGSARSLLGPRRP